MSEFSISDPVFFQESFGGTGSSSKAKEDESNNGAFSIGGAFNKGGATPPIPNKFIFNKDLSQSSPKTPNLMLEIQKLEKDHATSLVNDTMAALVQIKNALEKGEDISVFQELASKHLQSLASPDSEGIYTDSSDDSDDELNQSL